LLVGCPTRAEQPAPSPIRPTESPASASSAASSAGKRAPFDLDYTEGGGGPAGRSFSMRVDANGAVTMDGHDYMQCPNKGPGRNTFVRYGGDAGRRQFTMTPANFAKLVKFMEDPGFVGLPGTLGTGPGAAADGMEIALTFREGERSVLVRAKPDWNRDKLPPQLTGLHDLLWTIVEAEGQVPKEHGTCEGHQSWSSPRK